MKAKVLKLFYKGNKLSTVHTRDIHQTIVSTRDQNLFETQSPPSERRLLGTDLQGSTVIALTQSLTPITYSPFGYDNTPPASTLASRYTGQCWLPTTGMGYLLGHRLFNPALMRFIMPDNLSPFEKGGINAYVYCADDPINNIDPSGHYLVRILKKLNGTHRSQLYKKLNTIESTRNNTSTVDKSNSFGRRKYKALKDLNSRDLRDSKMRAEHVGKIGVQADEELLQNGENYSEELQVEFRSKFSAALKEANKALHDDLATQDLIQQMVITEYHGKNRYYLPPSQTNATVRNG